MFANVFFPGFGGPAALLLDVCFLQVVAEVVCGPASTEEFACRALCLMEEPRAGGSVAVFRDEEVRIVWVCGRFP